MLLSKPHTGLSWPKTPHAARRSFSHTSRLRRSFPPTPHSVPVRPSAAQAAGEPPEPSLGSDSSDASEQVLYATLTRAPEEEHPALQRPVLNKPAPPVLTEEEEDSELGLGSNVMEDLGTLFSEVGLGSRESNGRLSRALDQGVRGLKGGKDGFKMPPRSYVQQTNAHEAAWGRARPHMEKQAKDASEPVSPPVPELKSPTLGPPPPKHSRPAPPKKPGVGSWGPRPDHGRDSSKLEAKQVQRPGSAINYPPQTRTVQPRREVDSKPSNANPQALGPTRRPSNRTPEASVVAPKPDFIRSKPPASQSDDAVAAYFRLKHQSYTEIPPGLDENILVGDEFDVAVKQEKAGAHSSARNRGEGQKQAGNAKSGEGSGNKRQRKAFEGQFGVTGVQNRRKARQQRQEKRDSRAITQEREEIIEVGEEGLLVKDLALKLAVEPAEILKALFMKGIMATVTQTLDMDTVKVVGLEFGVEVWDKGTVEITDMAKKTVDFLEEDELSKLIDRPPVVTVMGHVDHGKTSLLDYIRQTSVASGEAGGITQAIGAYTCEVTVDDKQRHICFLDTPGHEAFSAMRARGARVTDVAIIIVAADDGIQPQTREAVNHAKAANVPIVVAINKIDKDGANPEQIKQQLGELELIPEDWGGKTPVIPISAKTGKGIDDLLEVICLMSEMELDLVANPDRDAAGTVVEADLDRRAGPIATLLVQNGTLRVGDMVVSGASYGKVRSLTNDGGNYETEAGPSVAVRMLGLNSVPLAGDSFEVVTDESEARQKAKDAGERLRSSHLAEVSGGGSMVTLSSLASIDEDDEAIQRVNIVLKADTSGAIEAVKNTLAKLPQDSVMLRFLHAAPGDITESDLSLAESADGFVLAYNVNPSDSIVARAKKAGVDVRSYDVIYDLLDDIRAAMEGRIKSVNTKVPIGSAEVRAVFSAGSRTVAGCMVTDGRLEKGCVIEVFKKKKKPVYEGTITSLRRIKEIVSVVEAGLECGVGSEFEKWEEGDRIEAFTLVEKHLSLEEAHATAAVDLEELKEAASSPEG